MADAAVLKTAESDFRAGSNPASGTILLLRKRDWVMKYSEFEYMQTNRQPQTITHVVIYSKMGTLDIEHFSETVIGEYFDWIYQKKARELQHIHKTEMTIGILTFRAFLTHQENRAVLLDYSI